MRRASAKRMLAWVPGLRRRARRARRVRGMTVAASAVSPTASSRSRQGVAPKGRTGARWLHVPPPHTAARVSDACGAPPESERRRTRAWVPDLRRRAYGAASARDDVLFIRSAFAAAPHPRNSPSPPSPRVCGVRGKRGDARGEGEECAAACRDDVRGGASAPANTSWPRSLALGRPEGGGHSMPLSARRVCDRSIGWPGPEARP